MVLLLNLVVATLLAQSALAQPAPAATDASVAGRVLDASTKTPIAAAQVILIPMRVRPTADLDRHSISGLTDRDGRFQFDGLGPGRYLLNVVKTGFTFADSGPQLEDIAVAAGERRADVTVLLQHAAVIAGRIVDDRGDPMPDARVTAFRRAPGSRDRLLPGGGPTPVNDLGEFRLVLRPGEYYVQAASSPAVFGESAARRSTILVPTFFPDTTDPIGAQPIAVVSGQTYSDVVIRLIEEPAFHVAGIVHTDDGRPVANALVRMMTESAAERPLVFADSRMQQVHTDAKGRFTIDNMRSGSYTVKAIAPVVIARAPAAAGGRGGIVGGTASGWFGEGIRTETRDGVTTEYRDDRATHISVTIGDASVDALDLVVPRQ